MHAKPSAGVAQWQSNSFSAVYTSSSLVTGLGRPVAQFGRAPSHKEGVAGSNPVRPIRRQLLLGPMGGEEAKSNREGSHSGLREVSEIHEN